jgi:hypothetical protein
LYYRRRGNQYAQEVMNGTKNRLRFLFISDVRKEILWLPAVLIDWIIGDGVDGRTRGTFPSRR